MEEMIQHIRVSDEVDWQGQKTETSYDKERIKPEKNRIG